MPDSACAKTTNQVPSWSRPLASLLLRRKQKCNFYTLFFAEQRQMAQCF